MGGQPTRAELLIATSSIQTLEPAFLEVSATSSPTLSDSKVGGACQTPLPVRQPSPLGGIAIDRR